MSYKLKEPDKIWISYIETRAVNDKHKLILHYIWLVKYVINNMNIPKNQLLNEDDFINIGILGLNHSIERFEPERGVKFESYAVTRIKGTIQDELRKLDWLSRSARKKVQDYIKVSDELRSKSGREASAEEIRKKLNVSQDKYKSYLEAASIAKASISMNESAKLQIMHEDNEDMNLMDDIPDSEDEDTLDKLVNSERIEFLTRFLKELPERKRLVITLYYYEEITFKEIGKILEVSESRISQIHSQVLNSLRSQLKEFDNA